MTDPLGQLRLRFAELRLVRDGPIVQRYVGRDLSGTEVTVAVLAGRAAGDPDTRRAFAEAVRRQVAGGAAVRADARAARPWVAAHHPGGPAVVDRVVAELGGSRARSRPVDPPGLVLAAPPVDPPLPVWSDSTLVVPPPASGTDPTGIGSAGIGADPTGFGADPTGSVASPPSAGPPSAGPLPPAGIPRPTAVPPDRVRPGGGPGRPDRPAARPWTAPPARRPHLPARPAVSPVAVTIAVVVGVMVLISFCSTGLLNAL